MAEITNQLKSELNNLLVFLKNDKVQSVAELKTVHVIVEQYIQEVIRPQNEAKDQATDVGWRLEFRDKQLKCKEDEAHLLEVVADKQCLNILFEVGLKKLLPMSDLQLDEEVLRRLVDRGYITILSLKTEQRKEDYFTLTSMGWSCFEQKAMQQRIKKVGDGLVLPLALGIAPKKWNILTCVRAMALQKYYEAQGKEDYLLFMRNNMLVGCRMTAEAGTEYVYAGIFRQELTEQELEAIYEAYESKEIDRVTVVVNSEESKAVLGERLRKSASNEEINIHVLKGIIGYE